MTEDQQSTAALDEAAAEAVESQSEEVTEEVVEETQAEVAETESVDELNGEGLPKDHKQRSDLGRKVSATHRRMDEIENSLSRIASLLEENAISKNQRENDPDFDADAPLTYADLERYSAERDKNKAIAQQRYDDSYRQAVTTLGGDLGEDEWQEVVEEMKVMPLDSTGDPQKDAERNFYKAERALLRKKLASKTTEKTNPLTKKEVPSGTVTQQKTVTRETEMPKLDSFAQSYYDDMVRRYGEEEARKRVQAIK